MSELSEMLERDKYKALGRSLIVGVKKQLLELMKRRGSEADKKILALDPIVFDYVMNKLVPMIMKAALKDSDDPRIVKMVAACEEEGNNLSMMSLLEGVSLGKEKEFEWIYSELTELLNKSPLY